MTTTLTTLSAALVVSLSACSSTPPQRSPDAAPAPVSATTPPGTPDTSHATAPASAPGTTTPAAAPSTPPATPSVETPPALSDEQILHVAHTANTGEIEQAKLAQSKAKDARVKKLAAMMLKDHTEADAKGTAIAKKANLTPAANPTSASLESDAQSATASMKSLTGADFDKAYVDIQVKEHQAVLDTIDQKLLPAAKNADVKAFLSEVRPKIAMHLQHAQDVQKEMSK